MVDAATGTLLVHVAARAARGADTIRHMEVS